MSRDRVVHVEHVWGTVVSIDIATHRSEASKAPQAIAEVVAMLHHVDRVFSTFRPDSEISRIRLGELEVADACAEVREVSTRCARIRDITHGLFDPWSVTGGFDPSGLVKGWAADRATEILARYGFNDVMIAAGGDIAVRGEAEPNTPWVIGLQHPTLPGEIHGTVSLNDGAVATSGLYERGTHIESSTEIKAISATVVGPDAATADGLATALLIAGTDGMTWFDRLPSYSSQVVVGDQVFARGEILSPEHS